MNFFIGGERVSGINSKRIIFSHDFSAEVVGISENEHKIRVKILSGTYRWILTEQVKRSKGYESGFISNKCFEIIPKGIFNRRKLKL
jgi:cell shape-determining protein MreC